MSETWTTSLTTLLSAGSIAPGLGLGAELALRMASLVPVRILSIHRPGAYRELPFQNDGGGLFDLVNDVCGLVYALVIECRRIMDNGQSIPDDIQRHIQALSK